MAITADRGFAALLDITRLVSRVGRGPNTGIDRVEKAYLDWCLATSADLWGIARVSGGLVLLDRSGLKAFQDKIEGRRPWGQRDLRARAGIKTPAARGAAEADLRRLAIARPRDLAAVADAINTPAVVYLNTGHSNLRKETLNAVAQVKFLIAVFLHDAIPLDHPEFQTSQSVEKFSAKLAVVRRHADIVITNSKVSAARLEVHGMTEGHRPIPISLGIDVHEDAAARPQENRPYFVTVGTIEPRKNHELLLDIWEDLGPVAPLLHIVGQRGWATEALFRRMDALQQMGTVIEHQAVDDAALWNLLSGAQALLFPSHAEGFGLPSLEAAALGTPLICGDLAIHRELLGAYPVYANTEDRYLWKQRIIELADKNLDDLRRAYAVNRPNIPTWDAHFERVNQVIMDAL